MNEPQEITDAKGDALTEAERYKAAMKKAHAKYPDEEWRDGVNVQFYRIVAEIRSLLGADYKRCRAAYDYIESMRG